VTSDRDSFSLIDENTRMLRILNGGVDASPLLDPDRLVMVTGVRPEQYLDLAAFRGDTSDNLPGVPGIGDKTAAQLLQKYGSLESVLEHVEEISGAKRQQNLREHAEDARVSKRLATMVRDVDAGIDLLEESAREPDRARLREVFRDFELRDPLRRLEEALGEGEAAAPAPRADVTLSAPVRDGTLGDLDPLEPEPVTLVARPPEAPEEELFSHDRPWRFAAYAAGGEAIVGEVAAPEELVRAVGRRPVVAHDAKALRAVPGRLAHDTMVAAYLLDPARRGYPLDELAQDRGIGADVPDVAAADALVVTALADAQRTQIAERGLERLLHEVELPLVHVLRRMEERGMRLDAERLDAISRRVSDEVRDLEREIHALAGTEFHIGSPQQLGEVLFVGLGLSRKRRGKTGFSTDARVLQAIRGEHEIIPKIERYRELSKLAQTYLDALPALRDARGRIHTTFNQAATATGRLSSTDPNLQNIPVRTPLGREIRACFVAEEGARLISADYSQVELRVLAHVAEEHVLKDIFRRGEDVHTATAAEVLGVPAGEADAATRSKAKMVNYGIVYGLSGYGLADRLQIPQEEAEEFIERYLDRFPAVRAYIERTVGQATQDGYVSTLFGRRRLIPELRARNRQVRLLGERLAVNTPIQGSAADIIKVAMVRCETALAQAGLTTRLILQIHDELLFEGPPEEVEAAKDIVAREMVDAFPLDPPLTVDVGVGENWMEAK
ncbi:MAG TPA: DNA polymerase I, partial [Solirubrobacteraceae bacterium]|nr:DNA polymerase I [Solirubrobacteraceae bacterium]